MAQVITPLHIVMPGRNIARYKYNIRETFTFAVIAQLKINCNSTELKLRAKVSLISSLCPLTPPTWDCIFYPGLEQIEIVES